MGLKGRTPTPDVPLRHFRELLVKSAPPAQAAARALRGAVRTALPAAAESLHGGSGGGLALYHVSGRLVCGIEPAAAATLLYVHGVGSEDAPAGMKLGGHGRERRHIRFASVNDVRAQADAIRTLLLKAATRR
jgi:hypothetical protein